MLPSSAGIVEECATLLHWVAVQHGQGHLQSPELSRNAAWGPWPELGEQLPLWLGKVLYCVYRVKEWEPSDAASQLQ